MSIVLLLKGSGGGPSTVTAEAHGRAHSRATAVRATATTTAAVHGRAHSRTAVFGAVLGTVVTATIQARGRGRASATGTTAALKTAVVISRGRGRSTGSGEIKSLIFITANSNDVIEMRAPLLPSHYDEIQTIRSKKPVSLLGHVCHTIISTSGEAANPIIGQWSSEDDFFGGYGPATGVIDEVEFHKHQEVYRDGSIWRTYHAQTGEPLWAGRLLSPDRHQGGTVGLTGRGWGQTVLNRPLEEGVMYAHYGGDGWFESGSGELNTSAGGGVQQFTIRTTGGAVVFNRDKDPDRTGSTPTGGENLVQFETPGTELSKLRFHLFASAHGTAPTSFRLVIHSFVAVTFDKFDISGGITCYNEVHSINSLIPTDLGEFEIDLQRAEGSNPGFDYHPDSVSVYVETQFTGAANGLKVILKDLQILGEPLDEDECSVGQVVADLCNRLGLPDDKVVNSGPDVLPYEVPAGTLVSETMSYLTLLSNKQFTVRGERATPDFSAPRDIDWQVIDERHEQDLVAAERFDTVLVPWSASTDHQVDGYRKVRLEDSPLDRHNNFGAIDWPFPIRARVTDGVDPWTIIDDRAEDLGLKILDQVSKIRWSGQGRMTEAVDENGIRQSARLIKAGDTVRYSHGEAGRRLLVTKVRQSDNAVDLEYDNQVALFLDRERARRELRRARRRG